MSVSRIRRSRLAARAAGTVGAMALVLGATVAPAGAATPHSGTPHTGAGPGTAVPDAPLANTAGGPVSGPVDDAAVAKAQAAANGGSTQVGTAGLPQSHAGPHSSAVRSVTPVIPAPTGPYQVGTVNLHLVDKTRYDPWVPTFPPRELMVQLWYPTVAATGHQLTPWLQSLAGSHFLASWNVRPGTVSLPTTAGYLGAPVDTKLGKLPVVLYSTGFHSDRSQGTTLAEDLASRGFLVVEIDSTHDAEEVQFPGNRLELETAASSKYTLTVRSADSRFVVDELGLIAKGTDPDVDHAPLPAGLAGDVDMSRIGMFGWSLGGATVATSMQLDPRIVAGADLDGELYGSVVSQNLKRPFLLFGASYHDRVEDGSWATFWAHQTGPRYELKLAGTEHLTFSDYAIMFGQAGAQFGLKPAQIEQDLGTLNLNRAFLIERTYLAAYFDVALHINNNPLMNGPSKSYPEISFIR
ncbi:dienelactone hydrolase [Streptacidiphilus sp. BW17]|uniref:alpha/beta hydrolase family protein n=2 Tax=Streptacidiphilus TaxID=228398 RepID=UPI003515E0FE